MNLIILPDTHGYLSYVEKMIAFLEKEGFSKGRKFAFLGDLFDRGPEIRGLLNLGMDLAKDGHIFIRGNHEEVTDHVLTVDDNQDFWLDLWFYSNHQDQTLESFGLSEYDYYTDNLPQAASDLAKAMTPEERAFIANLPYYYEDERQILVHASVLPDVSWEKQKQKLDNWNRNTRTMPEQLWQNCKYLPKDLNKQVISGHNIHKKAYITKYRACIDLGLFYHKVLAAYIPDIDLLIELDRFNVKLIDTTPSFKI